MQVVKLHEDEVDVDEGLVRRLLAGQAPAWADLPLRLAEPAGTDNVMVRLGEDLVVRLPRTLSAAAGLDKEQQVVPRLARHLPAPVPVPVVQGAPQGSFPWRWSISRWLPERPPQSGVADVGLARQLAEFVVALRTLDTLGLTAEGALHSYRGDPARPTRRRHPGVHRAVPRPAAHRAGHRCLGPARRRRGVRRAAGVDARRPAAGQPAGRARRTRWRLGLGMLALGDPAVDCLAAWSLLDATSRAVFRDRVGVDDATWARGRGWALSIALVALPYCVCSNSQITASRGTRSSRPSATCWADIVTGPLRTPGEIVPGPTSSVAHA